MGKDLVQGINDTTLYADKVYSQNFTQLSKTFVLSLHYNDDNSYLFVNGKQELKQIYNMHRYFMKKQDKMLLINLVVLFFNMLKVNALECVSVINQKCMSTPKIIEANPDEPVFYPLSIKVNKCGGYCNNINDPMAKLCVPDIVKDMNIKVFNLLARINETRKIVWHETCKCVCRLKSAICNDRQEWNENKSRCECKEDLVS